MHDEFSRMMVHQMNQQATCETMFCTSMMARRERGTRFGGILRATLSSRVELP